MSYASCFGSVRSFGELKKPYDLNAPGAVAEIKHVLRALANSANLSDDTTKHIDVTPTHIDAWDGPTSDALVLAVSRYRNLTDPLIGKDPNYVRIASFENIVGGPQPDIYGLELLAKAARKELKDEVQLSQYLAWRGGDIDSWISDMPTAAVTMTKWHGRPWDPRGWTLACRDPKKCPLVTQDMLSKLDMIEQSLLTSWTTSQVAKTEKERVEASVRMAEFRKLRHDLVLNMNKGVTVPSCATGYEYDSSSGRCMPLCGEGTRYEPAGTPGCGSDAGYCCVVDLAEVTIPIEPPIKTAGVSVLTGVALAAAAGVGLWFLGNKID